MKKVPIAVEDFKKIIEENYYYIDKTKFIEDILNDGAEVKLFCRPRRFGKTLNMSTLNYFFNIENKDDNRKLFNGLYIENCPVIEEQGKYPVIFLSMKGLGGLNWEVAFSGIKSKIKELFRKYIFLSEILDKYTLIEFEKYLINDFDEATTRKGLKFLTEILYKHYHQKVVILIDEYDSPIMSAYENGYYNEMRDFLKAFYGEGYDCYKKYII